ncbi:MAG: zinc-binding dehydrogenase [Bacteroidetes bacterium]|nr:zinc-binding dehydrogenase [Bacteroidota bacterium]
MQAYYIVKHGKPKKAFELRDINIAPVQENEVIVEVEAFGMNFADVMARLGYYKDCPPLPAVVGYEAVGRIKEKSPDVHDVEVGDRVVAFTRFGGYSQLVKTRGDAVVKISEDYPVGKALALAVQYCTAFYAAHVATNILPGDKVLIQAAAGGVGTALVQLCKRMDCTIYGTAGSDYKINHLKSMGVDHPINYRSDDFEKVIKQPLDIVFDSLGGDAFKKGYKLLDRGGRMVAYGAAQQTDTNNIFGKMKFGIDFGIYHPAQFIMESRSLIGVNMLRIADYKPHIIKHCLQQVVKMAEDGELDPHVGGMYPVADLAKVHQMMEDRKTMGKIGLFW